MSIVHHNALPMQKIKDGTCRYPDWQGPVYPSRLDLLQKLLNQGIRRPKLDHAAHHIAGFELARIENQPLTYTDRKDAHMWRVAYVYKLRGGGEAAIFIPHGSGNLHCAVYSSTARSRDDAELNALVSSFITALEM